MYTPLTLGISKLSRFQGRPQISQLGSGAGSDGSSYEHQRTTRTGGKALKIRKNWWLEPLEPWIFVKLQWFNALFDDFDVNVACFLKRFPVQDISASMGKSAHTITSTWETLGSVVSRDLFALQVVTRFPGAAAAGELRKVFLSAGGSWEFRQRSRLQSQFQLARGSEGRSSWWRFPAQKFGVKSAFSWWIGDFTGNLGLILCCPLKKPALWRLGVSQIDRSGLTRSGASWHEMETGGDLVRRFFTVFFASCQMNICLAWFDMAVLTSAFARVVSTGSLA